MFRPTRCGSTSAGAITRGRTITMCPLPDILPILLKARVGGLYVPFANPRHAHEYKVLRDLPLAP